MFLQVPGTGAALPDTLATVAPAGRVGEPPTARPPVPGARSVVPLGVGTAPAVGLIDAVMLAAPPVAAPASFAGL